MTIVSEFIKRKTLSRAWADAFRVIAAKGVREIAPLTVTFDYDPHARQNIVQHAIDRALRSKDLFATDSVASTMFPMSQWNSSCGRDDLFRRYKLAYPVIKRVPQNRYGTYFHRMMSYTASGGVVNQLDTIIRNYQSGVHRRSALQLSIFDPAKDHARQTRRGFPCMQQVAFGLVGATGLTVTGFYAVEYLFDKAYGNYLGLQDLGLFMAHELGRTLTQITCVAALALPGRVKGEAAATLLHSVDAALAESGDA